MSLKTKSYERIQETDGYTVYPIDLNRSGSGTRSPIDTRGELDGGGRPFRVVIRVVRAVPLAWGVERKGISLVCPPTCS